MSDTQQRKWSSEAGPRQTKQVNEALDLIIRETQMHTELWGVIGGEEHRSDFYTMFGGYQRPDITEALQKIGEQFDYTVTRKNYQDIIAACAAALPAIKAARPVVDKRRTLEQDAAQKAELAEIERKRQEENNAHKYEVLKHERELRLQYPWAQPADCGLSGQARAAANLKTELGLVFPGVKFSVTSASASMTNSVRIEYTLGPPEAAIDETAKKYQYGGFDLMQDMQTYDHSAYGEAVENVLGRAKWVRASRLIPDAVFERIGQLLCEAQQVEYRGNDTQHVFGDGDTRYLSQHVHKILERTFFPSGAAFRLAEIIGIEWSDGGTDEFTGKDVEQGYYLQFSETEERIATEPERTVMVPTVAGGITVRENTAKNGIEVKFASKEAALPFISQLKAHGFRWSKFQKLWYAKRSNSVIAFAYSLVDKAAA